MENKRDSFIFYRSFQNAIDEANEADQLLIYRAIAKYALDRKEPKLTGLTKLAWMLIKPQLDANWKRFENGCKGAEFGKNGGNPNFKKGRSNPYYENKDNPKDNPTDNGKIAPPITPNVNVFNANDNVNENKNDNDNEKESTKVDKPKAKRFLKPTLQLIENYISENKYNVNAEKFLNYYEANGWKVGRNPMKDWKAAVRTWNNNDKNSNKPKGIEVGIVLTDNDPHKYDDMKLW